jgi:RpiR family carbohydrate utilization transcriptional regulator
VLEVTERARKNGATVLAVTGGPGPLADPADAVLVLRTFEDTGIYTPTVSRLAGLVRWTSWRPRSRSGAARSTWSGLREMKEALSAFRGSSDTPIS